MNKAMVTAGVVRGIAAGSVTVTASINGITVGVTVTVAAADNIGSIVIEGFDGNPMAPEQTCQLAVKGVKAISGDRVDITDNVAWNYNNIFLAIDDAGLMTAVNITPVPVTVTATYIDPVTGRGFTNSITVEVVPDYITEIVIVGSIPDMVADSSSPLHICPITVEAVWLSGKPNTVVPPAEIIWETSPPGFMLVGPSAEPGEILLIAENADPAQATDVTMTAIYHDPASDQDRTDTVVISVTAEDPEP